MQRVLCFIANLALSVIYFFVCLQRNLLLVPELCDFYQKVRATLFKDT